MSNIDAELVKKPLAMDLLIRLTAAEGCTKSDLMRSYHDLMAKTVYYRLCEMADVGWIEYQSDERARNRISVTDKGIDVCGTVTSMLKAMEEI